MLNYSCKLYNEFNVNSLFNLLEKEGDRNSIDIFSTEVHLLLLYFN